MTNVVPYTRQPPELERAGYSADWLLDPAEIAQRIGGTDFVPTGLRGNAAAITAALLYGAEVGLGRMQSLAKIAVINGRPTLAAEAQRALILAAGHDLWIEENTTERCTVCGQRRGSSATSRVTWTMDDARRANLAGKQPWRMYPRQMLLARASAELARAVFPDAIGGLAATEELEDEPEPDNGTNPAPAAASSTKSRRRRRASVTAGPAPEPEPEPAAEPEPVEVDEAGRPALPADEQASLDELERQELARQASLDSTEQYEAEAGLAVGGPDPEPGPEPMTDAQRRKMHALYREQGIAERVDRLDHAIAIIGRPIQSTGDLTLEEAGWIIDALEQAAGGKGPA